MHPLAIMSFMQLPVSVVKDTENAPASAHMHRVRNASRLAFFGKVTFNAISGRV